MGGPLQGFNLFKQFESPMLILQVSCVVFETCDEMVDK